MITVQTPTRPRHMHVVELTDEDLTVVRTALETYLEDLGHEEAHLTRRIHEVKAKFPPLHPTSEAEAY